MCDEKNRFRLGGGLQIGEKPPGVRFIQRRRRFVEEQDVRILIQRPADAQPLALPAGERFAVFTQHGVIAAGRLQDFVMEIYGAGDPVQAFLVAGEISADVFANGGLERAEVMRAEAMAG